jgi:O-antigen/teichoic acid export membrane protein
MIWFVPSAIQAAFLQDTASNWASGKVNKINSNIKMGIKYSILSLALFGGGLFVLADSFLSVYFGPGYSDSAMALRILLIGTIFMGITRPVNAVLQATGRVRQTEIFSVGVLILNILLNIILIPRLGIVGAGVGTAISYIAMFGGRTLLWKWSDFKLVSLMWGGKIGLAQILFIITFFIVDAILNLRPLITLILLPPIGLFLFICINTGAGYISLERFSLNQI